MVAERGLIFKMNDLDDFKLYWVWCFECDKTIHIGTLDKKTASDLKKSHNKIPHVSKYNAIYYHKSIVRTDPKPKPKKYSILDLAIKYIKDHREKQATPEEIKQLQLNYDRAVLKARIAKEKHEARKHSRFTIIAQNFVKNVQSKNIPRSKRSKKSKSEKLDSDELKFHGLDKDEQKKLRGVYK